MISPRQRPWLVLAVAVAGSALAQPVHRFALFVGNNHGGPGTRSLYYAAEDARRLKDVFVRLGGLSEDDVRVAVDRSADEVLAALTELEQRSAAARQRGEQTAILFYYSGHASEGALLLGRSTVPMASLKERLAGSPADVRVVVFDACRSGEATRAKGVRRAPAFEIETDATRAARGLVILTSSAADEDSQESDLIGASYFSYHLATGLIGSADRSGDGKVSLHEAYAYAYERTVASTAGSSAGPQHPTFSFDLAGNGDLVLTDVTGRGEGLELPGQAPPGTYFVIDARGVVVAETVKAEAERRVALPPGTYTVKRRLADRLRVGEVRVEPGRVAVVDEASFRDARFSDDPVKGTGVSAAYARHWSLSATGAFQAVFDRPVSAGGYFPSAPVVGAEATVHNLLGPGFLVSLDGAYGWTSATVVSPLLGALEYRYSLITFGLAVGYEFNPAGRWIPFGGVHVAFNLMSRDFVDGRTPAQSYSVLTPGLYAGLKFRITRAVSVTARARVHYLLYTVDETRNLGTADLGLSLGYEFF